MDHREWKRQKNWVSPSNWIRKLCLQGRVIGARMIGPMWMMTSPVKIKNVLAEGFASSTQAAEMLGVSTKRVMQLCESGSIVGAHKQGSRWAIPVPINRIKEEARPEAQRRRVSLAEDMPGAVPSIDRDHDAEHGSGPLVCRTTDRRIIGSSGRLIPATKWT